MLSPSISKAFADAERHLGPMDALSAASLASAASDLALIVGPDATILDLSFSGTDLAGEGFEAWAGQALSDIVAPDSRGKIRAMLGELEANFASRRREINFLGEGGASLPMNCVAVRLRGEDKIMMFGRDMRGLARLQQRLVNTQISMEREYTRLRQAEACYRMLFQIVGEAVVIVDAATMAVTDANPVAADLLGQPVAKLVGRRATQAFGQKDREAIRALLASAQSVGKAEAGGIATSLVEGGIDVRASLFRQADVSYILLRLLTSPEAEAPATSRQTGGGVLDVIERLPDGFVIIDQQRHIKMANGAFLELVQAVTIEQVRDTPLDGWLQRSSVDVGVLMSNVREHGLVRRFPTVLAGMHGGSEDVEITAVSVTGGERDQLVGLVIRRAIRTAQPDPSVGGFPAQSPERLTELIGHMSLKEVVRETTDVVERLCIEAALKLTGDNRASAAQMLGVSRQSLYAKMRRFGIGDLTVDEEPT